MGWGTGNKKGRVSKEGGEIIGIHSTDICYGDTRSENDSSRFVIELFFYTSCAQLYPRIILYSSTGEEKNRMQNTKIGNKKIINYKNKNNYSTQENLICYTDNNRQRSTNDKLSPKFIQPIFHHNYYRRYNFTIIECVLLLMTCSHTSKIEN